MKLNRQQWYLNKLINCESKKNTSSKKKSFINWKREKFVISDHAQLRAIFTL